MTIINIIISLKKLKLTDTQGVDRDPELKIVIDAPGLQTLEIIVDSTLLCRNTACFISLEMGNNHGSCYEHHGIAQWFSDHGFDSDSP